MIDELKIIDEIINQLSYDLADLDIKLGNEFCLHGKKDLNCLHLETNKIMKEKVDKAIAEAVKMLRGKLKVDFFEKLALRAMDRIDTIDNKDQNLVIATIRIFDALPYILALTKKWRGKPYISTVSELDAKKELRARGLL